MSTPIIHPDQPSVEEENGGGRRGFMRKAGIATLSAGTVAILGGCETMARSTSPKADVGILNFALGKEYEAIAAYTRAAGSGLVRSKAVLNAAVLFRSHHRQHAGALAATVRKLGGTPVAAKANSFYAKELNAGALRSQNDVLNLALRLEMGAANAYLGAIPKFANSDLAKVAGQIAADETMHWTVLAQVTGRPLPRKALSFGG